MMSNNSSSNINKNKSNNNCSSTTASSLKSSNTTSNSSSSSSISRKINTISNNSNAVNKKHTSSGSGNSYTTHSGTGTGGGGNSHGTTMPGATSRRVAKRKASTVNIPPTVRKRRKIQHLPKPGDARQEQVPQTKNTVAVLNELKRNLVYNVESQTGPVHAPLFTISVVVDGQKFVGTGPSKKLARVAAAASALRSFIQFKDGATLTPIEPLQNVDFTSDDPMIENSIFPLSDTVAGGAGCGVLHEPLSVVTNGKPLPDVASAVAAGAGAATATAAISGNSSNNTNKYSSNSNSYSTGGSSSSISNSNSASSNINSVHTQHTVASSSIGNSSGRGSQAKYNHSGRQSNADTTTHALAHVKGGVRGGTSGGNVGNNGSVLRPGPDGATRDAAASAAGEKIGTAALDRHLPHHQQAPAAVAGHGGVETVRLLSVTAGATAPVAAAAGAAATTAVAASSLTTNITGASHDASQDQCISGSLDGAASTTVTAAFDTTEPNTSNAAAAAYIAVTTFPSTITSASSACPTIISATTISVNPAVRMLPPADRGAVLAAKAVGGYGGDSSECPRFSNSGGGNSGIRSGDAVPAPNGVLPSSTQHNLTPTASIDWQPLQEKLMKGSPYRHNPQQQQQQPLSSAPRPLFASGRLPSRKTSCADYRSHPYYTNQHHPHSYTHNHQRHYQHNHLAHHYHHNHHQHHHTNHNHPHTGKGGSAFRAREQQQSLTPGTVRAVPVPGSHTNTIVLPCTRSSTFSVTNNEHGGRPLASVNGGTISTFTTVTTTTITTGTISKLPATNLSAGSRQPSPVSSLPLAPLPPSTLSPSITTITTNGATDRAIPSAPVQPCASAPPATTTIITIQSPSTFGASAVPPIASSLTTITSTPNTPNSHQTPANTTTTTNGTSTGQNGHRQVVEKIQQSLDLFKNNNEKAVAWKKRFEKLKVSAANIARSSGPGAGNATGHHPKSQPEKGPVMLLHELFTDAHFECVSSDGLQHSKFTVVVTVNDNQRFEGTGPSKKMAKNAAAKAALASICNISFSPLQQSKFGLINAGAGNGALCAGSGGLAHNGDSSFKQGKNFELPQTFADAIGKLVIEKFNLVMQSSDVYSRRKVLAGFVMTYGYDVKTARVISLATGTKCVSGEHMSVTGSVINDSHAEIIARRGLMDFIYSQLDLLCRRQADPTSAEDTPAPVVFNGSTTAAGSIMVSANECSAQLGSKEMETVSTEPEEEPIFNKPNSETGLYTLKEGIYFHLYINTAPCGDARVFSPHENDSMDVDKHPNRKARGQLRTKVESGEGTIPVKSSEGIQTWDGVLQGQRLLTMSCSDKISRWNVLGLQGSLLASIIQPIYLHSIVLGSLLHPAHMYRAICGRIENAIQGLPPPYRLNKPKLALMTSAESRNQTKPPNFSINWITDCTEVEIVNSFTGKLINNNTNTSKMSRLSKQSFYRRYTNVIAQLPHVRFRDLKPTYFETKMSVVEYQQAKRELFAAFSKEDLGDWLKKPIEQDQFTLLTAKETDPPSQQQHQPQQQSQQQQQQQQVQQHGIQQLPQLLSPSSSAMPT
ncbi:uncharacterized protein LOC125952089 isoform X1 [Anopheles darlingi]|uniref:uncharacterized protein LOC125952089 isoform X1 n=1 Tax=Anopheles darlingi TaxID=43151 RepID=UPI002100632F|nr:uncharacterized protein LOC125952089 isoform X1 [Anopheles darlingi]XP_049537327.1 uncharacterized protein LOC125952089 isoform X1 [Anopheles darlingi]